MLETFKWQSANCVWAQMVTQYASAPVSEFSLLVRVRSEVIFLPSVDASLAVGSFTKP